MESERPLVKNNFIIWFDLMKAASHYKLFEIDPMQMCILKKEAVKIFEWKWFGKSNKMEIWWWNILIFYELQFGQKKLTKCTLFGLNKYLKMWRHLSATIVPEWSSYPERTPAIHISKQKNWKNTFNSLKNFDFLNSLKIVFSQINLNILLVF